jgi:DNA-binding transcriptional LysR family regulator
MCGLSLHPAHARDRTLPCRRRIALNETHAWLAADLQGLGLLQIGDFVDERHLSRGELMRVLPDLDNGSLPLHIVYQPTVICNPTVRAFVDRSPGC